MKKQLLMVLLAALLSACGQPDDENLPVAADIGEQRLLGNADYLAMPPYSTADLEAGEKAARICRTCHSFERDGRHKIGPNLHGFFGRQAGFADDFNYSPALQAADFAWTPAVLDAWLARPARFLPGNRMSFQGLSDPEERLALISYLLLATE